MDALRQRILHIKINRFVERFNTMATASPSVKVLAAMIASMRTRADSSFMQASKRLSASGSADFQ